jgi:heat shock protein HslJ
MKHVKFVWALIALIGMMISGVMAMAQDSNPLTGTKWTLVGSGITIEFGDDNSVFGSGGCNRYSGSYTVDGDTITFGAVASTRMMCMDESVMAREMAFFSALSAATRIETDGEQLTLNYGANQRLIFARVNPLPGTAWQLISFDGSTPAGTITLQFDDQGRATGSGGCNQFGGSFVVESDGIQFSQVISTERACLNDDVMAQESAFYAALSEAVLFSINDDELTITYGDNQTLIFAPLTPLSNTRWTLTSLGGAAPTGAITLDFGVGDRVGGNGGCNTFGSGYTLSGDAISFQPIISTMMACQEPLLAEEILFFEALQSAYSFTLTDDGLTIMYADGLSLVFVPAAA